VGTWGGKRAGAGRKPGIGNNKRAIAARSRHKAQRIEFEIDARRMAMTLLEAREPEILDRLLSSEDDRVVLQTWAALRGYASGPPTRTISIEVGPSPAQVLAEIAEERRKRSAVTVGLLPEAPDA